MDKEKTIKELDEQSKRISTVIGMLTVPAMSSDEVNEAHSLCILVGNCLDDLINNL